MRVAHLKVVQSSQLPGLLSVRGPKGRGHFDDCQTHITNAGFKDGEDVVLISRDAFDALCDHALPAEED